VQSNLRCYRELFFRDQKDEEEIFTAEAQSTQREERRGLFIAILTPLCPLRLPGANPSLHCRVGMVEKSIHRRDAAS
jgi:hypothetical protein